MTKGVLNSFTRIGLYLISEEQHEAEKSREKQYGNNFFGMLKEKMTYIQTDSIGTSTARLTFWNGKIKEDSLWEKLFFCLVCDTAFYMWKRNMTHIQTGSVEGSSARQPGLVFTRAVALDVFLLHHYLIHRKILFSESQLCKRVEKAHCLSRIIQTILVSTVLSMWKFLVLTLKELV